MTDHLQVLYDVLINGTEATDPNWDRLIAASAVEKALKQRQRLAELEAAARHVLGQEVLLIVEGKADEQFRLVPKRCIEELRNALAASSPDLGTEEKQ